MEPFTCHRQQADMPRARAGGQHCAACQAQTTTVVHLPHSRDILWNGPMYTAHHAT